MRTVFSSKLVALAAVQIFLLTACDAANPLSDAAVDDTAMTNALKVNAGNRALSLYLEASTTSSYVPIFENRLVIAEPVYTVPVTVVRAQALVDGVNVVYYGESCPELQKKNLDIRDCVVEETVEFRQGEIESTVITDSEGFANIHLSDTGKYRLRVQSFATKEDSKCYWGGDAVVDDGVAEVAIPLYVFCE